MKKLVERFLKYIRFDTSSDAGSQQIPSTLGQLELGRCLREELERMGAEARMIKSGVVYGHLASNSKRKDIPAIGFIAHMDTPQNLNCRDIKPNFIKKYDGNPVVLNQKLGIALDPKKDTFLKELIGHDLITTDGTTILGADDKAGIAELMTMMDILVQNPQIEHGDVYVAFSVDEEIGRGIEYFDLDLFPCDFAYTVDIDGNDIHCLDYESICGGWVEVAVRGKPVHPGTGTGVLRNASVMAMEFHQALPLRLDPFYSKEYEGINHLADFSGKVDCAHMKYRVSNFEEDGLWEQMKNFERIAEKLNEKYSYPAFSVTMRQSYSNMKKYIERDMRSVEYAARAMKAVGLNVKHRPIRGGTDGALLSQKGILTPNLNNGSYNALSYHEVVSVDYMKKCVELFVKIVTVE